MKFGLKKIKFIIKNIINYTDRSLYNEDDYLYYNHDVFKAVQNGVFKNGHEHYIQYGKKELRKGYNPKKNYLQWLKKRKQKLPKGDLTSDSIHIFISIEVYEYDKIIYFYNSLQNQKKINWKIIVYIDSTKIDNNLIENYYSLENLDNRIIILVERKLSFSEKISQYIEENNVKLLMPLFSYVNLRPGALEWFIFGLGDKNKNVIVYSDNDLVSSDGIRHSPNFKSDWNREFHYSGDMIGVCVLVGIFDQNYKHIADFFKKINSIDELIFSAMGAVRIEHVPEILYSINDDYLSSNNRVQILRSHFSGLGLECNIQEYSDGIKIDYKLPPIKPQVNIIIPTKNGYKILKNCLDSITKKTDYENYKIIIADNGSDDPDTLAYLQKISKSGVAEILRMPGPFNFSKINNDAVKFCDGSILAFINDDVEVISSNWLSEMVSLAVLKNVGAVGARLWYPDGRLQHGGVLLGIGGAAGHAHKFYRMGQSGYQARINRRSAYSAVTGACLIIEKCKFNEVGGFDDVNLKVAYNDIDLCLKLIECGYENIWTPFADLYHHESISKGV